MIKNTEDREALRAFLSSKQSSIFPTKDSCEEAVETINESLPEISRSQVMMAIMTYQNTLLNQLIKELT